MTRDDRQRPARERARDPGEPGASSGAESTPRRRTVPGTASAREGYAPGEGTGAGEQLKGREAHPRGDDAEGGHGRGKGRRRHDG